MNLLHQLVFVCTSLCRCVPAPHIMVLWLIVSLAPDHSTANPHTPSVSADELRQTPPSSWNHHDRIRDIEHGLSPGETDRLNEHSRPPRPRAQWTPPRVGTAAEYPAAPRPTPGSHLSDLTTITPSSQGRGWVANHQEPARGT